MNLVGNYWEFADPGNVKIAFNPQNRASLAKQKITIVIIGVTRFLGDNNNNIVLLFVRNLLCLWFTSQWHSN